MGPLDMTQKKLRPRFRPNLFLATLIFFGNPLHLRPGFTIENFRVPAPFLASLEQKVDFARFGATSTGPNFKGPQLGHLGGQEAEILYGDPSPIQVQVTRVWKGFVILSPPSLARLPKNGLLNNMDGPCHFISHNIILLLLHTQYTDIPGFSILISGTCRSF